MYAVNKKVIITVEHVDSASRRKLDMFSHHVQNAKVYQRHYNCAECTRG